MNLLAFKNLSNLFPKTPRLPALFVGHGSPQNAIENNEFTRSWEEVGKHLPKPNAVLCISAHWFVDGTYVHGSAWPQTIHDFYGFAPELYALRYACPGSPDGAREVLELLNNDQKLAPPGSGATGAGAVWDEDWGLDHGCWVVLKRLFPAADVPVFQMSIDYTKPASFHYQLAGELAKLRERGVLIIGSGNIVHNLGLITFEENAKPYDWAIEFDIVSKNLIAKGDHQSLIDYKKLGLAAHHAIPTPDHYLPLLYTLGAQQKNENIKFFAEGISHKSISMRSLIIS